MEDARRRIPKPSWYLPRSLFCRTMSRLTKEPTNLDTVDLWMPISSAISLTPASPSRARISRIWRARSTDWTPPPWVSASLSESGLLRAAMVPRVRCPGRPPGAGSPARPAPSSFHILDGVLHALSHHGDWRCLRADGSFGQVLSRAGHPFPAGVDVQAVSPAEPHQRHSCLGGQLDGQARGGADG